MDHSVKPLLDLLEVKQIEIERVSELKSQNRKNIYEEYSDESSNNSESNGQAAKPGADKESDTRSLNSFSSDFGTLEEDLTKSSCFSILTGSFLRRNLRNKSLIGPRSVSLNEFQAILSALKVQHQLLQSSKPPNRVEQLMQRATDNAQRFQQEVSQKKVNNVTQAGVAQLLGMLNHIQAQQQAKSNSFLKCTRQFWAEEKLNHIHPSCKNELAERAVKEDSMLKKCVQSHPHFYFNNLGLVHMKLRKYRMSALYYQKALKYLHAYEDRKVQVKRTQNHCEEVSSFATQKQHEILFNLGVTLYKSGKHLEAFRSFEKVSIGPVSSNPKLWFYMGLCTVALNGEIAKGGSDSQTENEVFFKKIGFGQGINYASQWDASKHRRFLMAPSGDQVTNTEKAMREFEAKQFEAAKKHYFDKTKKANEEQFQGMSKAQQKKFEKATLSSYHQLNSMQGQSLQLDSAVMYMQNVLSCIDQKVQNEVRYSLHFAQVSQAQMYSMDITNQVNDILKDRFSQAIQRDGMMQFVKKDLDNDSTDVDEEHKSETSFWRSQTCLNDYDKINQAKNVIVSSILKQPSPKTQEEHDLIAKQIKQHYYKKYANLIKNTH